LLAEVDSDKFVKTCRPFLDPIASVFHRLLCGRSDARGETLDTSPLPGSDSFFWAEIIVNSIVGLMEQLCIFFIASYIM
jgi:hypothetical protein